MADHNLEQIIARVRRRLSGDSQCTKPIRSLERRGITPESIIEPMCWFVLLDGQRKLGTERVAAQGQTGHDWRSLKRLPGRVARHLEERKRLETVAGRHLQSFSGQRKKLDKETKGIHPSAVLSPDLLTQSIRGTLEEQNRMLSRAVPNIPEYLRQSRKMQLAQAREALEKLVQSGLNFQEISDLLSVTAQVLGSEKYYSAVALKMRLQRAKRRV
jgi:hypothetical protein